MSSTMTIYPQDVLDQIKHGDAITVKDIGKQLGCSPGTVRAKLRILRRDKEPIYFTPKGYKYGADITTVEEAIEVKQFQSALLGSFKTIQLFAGNNKKVIKQSMRVLKYDMTPKERKELKQATANMLTLMNMAEAEMEFGEGE